MIGDSLPSFRRNLLFGLAAVRLKVHVEWNNSTLHDVCVQLNTSEAIPIHFPDVIVCSVWPGYVWKWHAFGVGNADDTFSICTA